MWSWSRLADFAGGPAFVAGLVALASALIAACEQELPEVCTQPLDACTVGQVFAECGGPAAEGAGLACSESQGCKWFTGACIAEGFQASDCAEDDICCHDGWPFEAGFQPGLHTLLYGLGTQPWDAARAAHVDVTIDATLAATGAQLACDGPDLGLGANNPCTGFFGTASGGVYPDTVVVASPNLGVEGWYPWIELISGENGPRARACAFAYTDVNTGKCPTRSGAPCAEPGSSLTLNRWPASAADLPGLVVELDLQFANGLRLTGQLALP